MYKSTKGAFLPLCDVIQLLSYLTRREKITVGNRINRGPQLPPG